MQMKLQCQGREQGLGRDSIAPVPSRLCRAGGEKGAVSPWCLCVTAGEPLGKQQSSLWQPGSLCCGVCSVFPTAGRPQQCWLCPWHGSSSQPGPGEEGELGSVRMSLVDQSLSREGRQELP